MLLFSRGFCSSHTMGCVSGAAGEGGGRGENGLQQTARWQVTIVEHKDSCPPILSLVKKTGKQLSHK